MRQIYYRLLYAFKKKIRLDKAFSSLFKKKSFNVFFLALVGSISRKDSFNRYEFNFLNKKERFLSDAIDWNYAEYGKLWTYNLNYFDYLNQENLTVDEGLGLIHDFILHWDTIRDGKESHPTSVRCINWLKFISTQNIKRLIDNDALHLISASILEQYYLLYHNVEYHLMGNHLLENGCSLLWGSYYFKNERFYTRAKKILISELNEQVLSDGAHFELSPMYHSILLYRFLDCYNLVVNNSWKNDELSALFLSKIIKMFLWLRAIMFSNGDIPCVGDTTQEDLISVSELYGYAKRLGIDVRQDEGHFKLSDSGYRMIKENAYELFVDVGDIGPDYQPGHAHSDTFNFILYVRQRPFIVDTGVSTYDICDRRLHERSTAAHNTVEIAGLNQSEVWKSFRVGNRAKIVKFEESNRYIRATHDGYRKKLSALHTRIFKFEENDVLIEDLIEGQQGYESVAFYHFAPGIKIKCSDNEVIIDGYSTLLFKNASKIEAGEYDCALGFNKYECAHYIRVTFYGKLTTIIKV
jgi:hypothetical protein